MAGERKVIQICAQAVSCGEYGYDVLHALCDDGTIWMKTTNQNWERLDPIPQDDDAGDPA